MYCVSLSALLLLLFVLHWHFFCLSLSMGCRMTSERTVQHMFLPQKPNFPQKKSCRSRSALHVQECKVTGFNRRKATDDDATDVLLYGEGWLFLAVVSDHLLAVAIRQTSTENVQSGREVSNAACVCIQLCHWSVYWAFNSPTPVESRAWWPSGVFGPRQFFY